MEVPFPLLKCILLCLSQAIPCCANPKQGENTKCARAAPDSGSFSSSSTFCTAKLSTRVKIATDPLIVSSLASAGGKSSDTDDICLSHALSRCTSPVHRPPCDLGHTSQKHTRGMFSASRGNHTLFSLLAVWLAEPYSSNIYLGKMKQHGKVTRGRRAEGMTQLWTWIQTKMTKSSQTQKKKNVSRLLIPILHSDSFPFRKRATNKD